MTYNKNAVQVLTSLVAASLASDDSHLTYSLGYPLSRRRKYEPEIKSKKVLTDSDIAAIQKAEAKRERRKLRNSRRCR